LLIADYKTTKEYWFRALKSEIRIPGEAFSWNRSKTNLDIE